MLIPLGTDRASARGRVVTPILLAVNLVVFATMSAMERVRPDMAEWVYGWALLDPAAPRWWAFATYAFLHAGVLHIGFNMLFLWVFAPPVEDRFGRVGFALFYLLGGAAAGGLHVLFEDAKVLGASGAVAAVTGAFLVMFPRTHVRCLALLGGGVVNVAAWWFIAFAVTIDLVFHALGTGGGIARLAHLGGYAFGGGVAMALLGLGVLPREPFDLFSMAKQARRRRVLREAAREIEASRAGVAQAFEAEPNAALLAARAEVSRLAGSGDADGAAIAYEAMLERFAAAPRAQTTMSRRHQLDLANHLFARGRDATALEAYERFAAAYSTDRETPHALVLAALIAWRRLSDAPRARAALAAIRNRLEDPEHDALARALTAELRAQGTAASAAESEAAAQG
ncbi:MAG: rhomboid family intramembrane serine protease [Phycisphaerae bacterium]|nr:rhomboid family intramembrane serine protease [Phycisphaerae bacterium]